MKSCAWGNRKYWKCLSVEKVYGRNGNDWKWLIKGETDVWKWENDWKCLSVWKACIRKCDDDWKLLSLGKVYGRNGNDWKWLVLVGEINVWKWKHDWKWLSI